MSNDARYEIKEVGVFTPKMYAQPRLDAGDVGYFIANIKTTADIKIGDTITDQRNPARRAASPDSRKFIRWCSAEFIRSTPATSSI